MAELSLKLRQNQKSLPLPNNNNSSRHQLNQKNSLHPKSSPENSQERSLHLSNSQNREKNPKNSLPRDPRNPNRNPSHSNKLPNRLLPRRKQLNQVNLQDLRPLRRDLPRSTRHKSRITAENRQETSTSSRTTRMTWKMMSPSKPKILLRLSQVYMHD